MGEYGHGVSILSRPPGVFWFLFHVEKELAPQGETLENREAGASSRPTGFVQTKRSKYRPLIRLA